jgi:competence protein ComEA
MKDLLKIAFGLICGLLAAGLILLAARQPSGAPVTLLPLPSPAPLVVHVNGAVAQPGVYTLPVGSRVQDAIDAAGGFALEADEQSLNLAAALEDGSQITVLRQLPAAEPPIPEPTVITRGQGAPLATPARSPTPKSQKININTATQEELESLPMIGPVLAQQIIDYRTANGPFKKIEDIVDVPGIGAKTFEAIRDLITVSSS